MAFKPKQKVSTGNLAPKFQASNPEATKVTEKLRFLPPEIRFAIHFRENGNDDISQTSHASHVGSKFLRNHEPAIRLIGLRLLLNSVPFMELKSEIMLSLYKKLQDVAAGDECPRNRDLSILILGMLGFKVSQFLASFGTSSKKARNPNRRGPPKHKVNVFSSWTKKVMNEDSAQKVLDGIIDFLRSYLALEFFKCVNIHDQQPSSQFAVEKLAGHVRTLQHLLWSLAYIFKGLRGTAKTYILEETAVVPVIEVRRFSYFN
jgi:hypothetical protein